VFDSNKIKENQYTIMWLNIKIHNLFQIYDLIISGPIFMNGYVVFADWVLFNVINKML
jgi:hypothetical protein